MFVLRIRSRSGRWLLFLPVGVVLSCGLHQPDAVDVTRAALGAGTFTFTVSLPAGVDPAAVVLAASDRVAIADRSVIDPPASGARPLITNTGTSQSSFGVDTKIRTDILSRPPVFLAERAAVSGGITTGGTVTRQNGTTVGGAILEHQTISVAPVSWTVAFPASSIGVSLEPGQTRSITPGVYADVNVKSGAVLTLASPGTYFFDSLNVEPNGGRVVLNGNGPFTVYVRANLTLKGPLVRPTGAPPVATTLAFAGSTAVYLSAPFQGLLVAPRATLTLANIGTGIHDASFFARTIELQASVKVRHRPATLGPPETLAPPAPGGTFRCALVGRSAAVLGGSQTSSLFGTASLTLRPNGSFTLDLLDARGSSVCSGSSCSKILLRPDPAAVHVGSFSTSDGVLQINLAAVVRFADRSNRDSAVTLAAQGRLQHRRLSAFASGSLPADAPLFAGAPVTVAITCDQQEPHQIVEATFNVDSLGAISASDISVREGNRPVLPLEGQGYVLSALDEQGGRVDQISFFDPRTQFDAPPLEAGSLRARLAFANGIRTLVLDGPGGPASLSIDLTSAISSFCASRPANPECLRFVSPGAMQTTTLAASPPGTDPVPGVNTTRALGPEVQVAFAPGQGSNLDDVLPSVAAIPSGTIAVGWFRSLPAVQDRSVMLRFFDRNGAPLSGEQTLTTDQVPTGIVEVSGSSVGQFVAVWDEFDPATAITRVIAQRFGGSGQPVGSRVTVASGTATIFPHGPNVALDGVGRFVVAWDEVWFSGCPGGVPSCNVLRARRFTASDQPDGGPIQVSNTGQGSRPMIAADDIGRFVIASNEGSFPIYKIRRFDQNQNGAPAIDVISDPNPQLAIAMTPDTGEFTFLHSDGSQVMGRRYAANGQPMGGGRLDGRTFGNQDRPHLAILPGGEMLTTWASATNLTRSEIRVSAQAFVGEFVAIDIDFDAGLSRIPLPGSHQGFDPRPRVAPAGDRFAVVWEAPGGIRMQLFRSGPYVCPANVNCGSGPPLMINGDPENVYNLMLVRGDPCDNNDGLGNFFTPNAFSRLAASFVASSFFEENIEVNRRRLNVFRGEHAGCNSTGEPITGPFSNMDSIGFASSAFNGRALASRAFIFGNTIALYRHESAHSMFNVADEYACQGANVQGTRRYQPPVHGNLFVDLGTCTSLSVNPSACHLIPGAPSSCDPPVSWSKADIDDIMGGSTNPMPPFGPDCKAQIREIFERIPCPNRGSASCR